MITSPRSRPPLIRRLVTAGAATFVLVWLMVWVLPSGNRARRDRSRTSIERAHYPPGSPGAPTRPPDAQDDSRADELPAPREPAGSREPDPANLAISGRVLTIRGRAINGATVRLLKPSPRSTPTDANGRFRIELGGASHGDLLVSAEAFGTHRRLGVPTGTRGLEIRLDREFRTRGTIRFADGEPAANLRVEALSLRTIEPDRFSLASSLARSAAADAETTTDAKGRFELRGLRGDRYQLRASGPGARETLLPTLLRVGPEVESTTWTIERGQALAGRLVDRERKPLEGLEVRVRPSRTVAEDEQSVRSDARGMFRFDTLSPGPWDLRVTPGGPWSGASRREVSLDDLPIEIRLSEAVEIGARVVDESGTAVERALVRRADDHSAKRPAESTPHRVAITDASGRFRLLVPPGASIDLIVEARGYRRAMFPSLPEKDDEREIVLERSAIVSGRVISFDGRPSRDTSVRLNTPEPSSISGAGGILRSTRTDADGMFQLSIDIPYEDQVLNLRAFADGGRASKALRLSTRELREGAQDVVLRLPASGAIRGRIHEARKERGPLGGIPVRLSTHRDGSELELNTLARSRADGSFVFPAVPPAEYSIRVDASGFSPLKTGRFDVRAGEISQHELSLAEEQRITGRVLDARGHGVPGASIELIDPRRGSAPRGRRSSRSDQDGRFLVGSLGDGPYRLRVEARRLAPLELTDVFPADVRAEEGSLEIVLRDLGRLSGLVTRQTDGAAVREFRLSLLSTTVEQRSYSQQGPWNIRDEQGAFALDDVATGDYVMRVRARGFLDETRAVRVSADSEPRDLLIELRRGRGAEVVVIDRVGSPVVGAHVQAVRVGGGKRARFDRSSKPDTTPTDVSGRAVIEGLTAGRWLFEVRANDYMANASRVVTLDDSDSAERPLVSVTLTRGVTVRGLAITSDGGAVSGATILLLGGRAPRSVVTAEDGSFEFRGIGPGSYRLSASPEPASPFAGLRATVELEIPRDESGRSIVHDLVLR